MDAAMPGARLLPESLYPGHPPLLELPTPRAVLAAVQMNAIEFHTWNAVKTAIDKPDRIVFDLDPGEGVPWRTSGRRPGAARVVERDRAGRVAQDQRRQGLHVLVPLRRQHGWGNHEGFFSGPGAASGAGLAAVVRGQERSAQPGGQDLRGLPAQRLWRDDRGALVARARRLPISVPISWDELEQVRGGAHWTIGRAGAIGYRQSSLDGYAPQAWASHGGAWFASVVKARRRARGRRRQGRVRAPATSSSKAQDAARSFPFHRKEWRRAVRPGTRAHLAGSRVRLGVGHQRMSRAAALHGVHHQIVHVQVATGQVCTGRMPMTPTSASFR